MTFLVVSIVAVAVLLVALVVFLAVRDRGRDRSSREAQHRDDYDIAGRGGATFHAHNTPGPGA
jgi:hypothetical protein